MIERGGSTRTASASWASRRAARHPGRGASFQCCVGADARTDFLGVIYGGSRDRGTGGVPSDAPPLFTLCAADDPIAAPGITGLYQAWRDAGLSAEMHVYAKGGHGFGMRPQGLPTDTWIERFGEWLTGDGHHRQLMSPVPGT